MDIQVLCQLSVKILAICRLSLNLIQTLDKVSILLELSLFYRTDKYEFTFGRSKQIDTSLLSSAYYSQLNTLNSKLKFNNPTL